MIDPSQKPVLAGPGQSAGPCGPANLPTVASGDGASAERGARFQSLLEELDLRAKAMTKSAQEPLSAESLPAAVENARSSMQDALELSRSLLEAFRQSTTQASQTRSLT